MGTSNATAKKVGSTMLVRLLAPCGLLAACLIAETVLGITNGSHESAGVPIVVALAGLIAGAAGVAAVSHRVRTGIAGSITRIDAITTAFEENLQVGLRALANGDLTVHLSAKTQVVAVDCGGDEIAELGRRVESMRSSILGCYDSYNQSTEKLRELVGRVSSTARSVGDSSGMMASTSEETGRATGEIARAIEHVAQGAERQVHVMETARRAAEEVASAVSKSAQQAGQASEVAHRTLETARLGMAAAEQADSAMRSVRDSSQSVTTAISELASKSEHVGAIVGTITGIAEQTNLLALNAAIEAARAGEQGRGFAVVADEVRKLAEESQQAAQEISDLIGTMQQDTAKTVTVVQNGAQKTADGAAVVDQARQSFLSIGEAVEDMTTRIEQIAAASEQITATTSSMQENLAEAAAVAEESSAATEQVSASTAQTSASTQQIAASAAKMASNAEALRALVSNFQLAINDVGSLNDVLAAALDAHEAWNAKLRQAIATGECATAVEQARRDDCCTFGKWLHAAGSFQTDQPARWQAMHDLHEQFHTNAGAVLECAISGRQAEAQRLLEAPAFISVKRDLHNALVSNTA